MWQVDVITYSLETVCKVNEFDSYIIHQGQLYIC